MWQSSVAQIFDARAGHDVMVATAAYGEALMNAPRWSRIEDVLRPLLRRNEFEVTPSSTRILLSEVI